MKKTCFVTINFFARTKQTAYNNKSNYMRVVTFDKYCEMLEKCEEEQNDRDRFNSQKYK